MWPFVAPRQRVLILCTANICRSPVAARLLAAHLKRCAVRGVTVLSAGTAVAAPGAPADPRMVALARERGLRLRGHRARPVSDALLAGVEQVFAMERQHLDALAVQCPGYAGHCALIDPSGEEVPDPYFGSRADVRATFERLDELCAQRAGAWIEGFPPA